METIGLSITNQNRVPSYPAWPEVRNRLPKRATEDALAHPF